MKTWINIFKGRKNHMFSMHLRKKKEWFGCERIKTDTSKQEQAHKVYGKEAYEHSSKQYDIHTYEMMNYIARKEGVKRLSRFLNGDKIQSSGETKQQNYCQATQNCQNVDLIYSAFSKTWKLPVHEENSRSPALFHPLLNIKLINKILQKHIGEGAGKI